MDSVAEIYNRIGQRIVDSIENEWVEAKLYIEFIGSVKSSLEYITGNADTKTSFLVDSFKNMKDIKDLNTIMTENGNNKWNKAIFSIIPSGKFNMEFIWDQDLQDEIERLAKE